MIANVCCRRGTEEVRIRYVQTQSSLEQIYARLRALVAGGVSSAEETLGQVLELLSGAEGKAKDKATVEDSADVEAGSPTSVDRQESMRGVDEEAGPKDFYPPASVAPAPVVWLPRDALGLGAAEARACAAAGVEASTRDAVMDEKGHVDIQGPPPDEERDDE